MEWGDILQIIDYIEKTCLHEKSELERAKLLCYYELKENGEKQFTMAKISAFMVSGGFNAPNKSRLREKLTKGKEKVFLITDKKANILEFIPVVYQSLEQEYGDLWTDFVTIVSDSELIDEGKFCGKRQYLDRLIHQINHTYSNNCYDAAAVLMRRLFEILLILTYQNLRIDEEIKDSQGKGYVMLEAIVKNVKNNSIIKLSRIKNEFDNFRMIGNFSAHNITYTACKKDIDDIKLNYRVMLEELYNKSGLI